MTRERVAALGRHVRVARDGTEAVDFLSVAENLCLGALPVETASPAWGTSTARRGWPGSW